MAQNPENPPGGQRRDELGDRREVSVSYDSQDIAATLSSIGIGVRKGEDVTAVASMQKDGEFTHVWTTGSRRPFDVNADFEPVLISGRSIGSNRAEYVKLDHIRSGEDGVTPVDRSLRSLTLGSEEARRITGRVIDLDDERTKCVIKRAGIDYLVLMPDGEKLPANLDRGSRGTLSSGRDGKPRFKDSNVERSRGPEIER